MTKIKVSIVDDEKLFISGLKMILNQQDNIHVNYTALNGQDYLDQIEGDSMISDVILLDLSMPVLDGIDTLEKLLEIDPDAKVIILSSHYNDSVILRLLDAGASGFLAKNSNPQEVIEAIEGVSRNGFHINNEILHLIRNKKIFTKKKKTNVELSTREVEILKLICEEFTNKEIAQKLFISPRTVEGHRNHILEKTMSKNTAGIVIYAVEHKLYDVKISHYS